MNKKVELQENCCYLESLQVKPENSKYLSRAEVTTALSLLNCNSPGYAEIVWKVLDKQSMDIGTNAGGLAMFSVTFWHAFVE